MQNNRFNEDRSEIFSHDGSICLSSFSAVAAAPPPKKASADSGSASPKID